MRILFLAPDVFRNSGGIARYCRLVCKALSDSHEVERIDVVSLHDACEQPTDGRYLSSAKGDYYPVGGQVSQFVKQIIYLSAKRKYDVYLVGHVNFATLIWGCRVLFAKSSIISLAYGIEVWERRAWLRRIGMTQSDRILAISNFTRERMIQANDIAPDKFRLLYNCFDPNLEHKIGTNGAKGLKLRHPNLITVSRISMEDRHKGHETIIRAIVEVRKQFPDLQYYIIGKGDLVAELQALVTSLNLDDNVHFLGFVSDEDLISIYEQCDLYVMPSSKEGFGYVFAEAMAYGKAVVAGNIDATVEVVRDQETGLLVDPANHQELAAAITLLFSNDELREKMGRRGAQIMAKEFGFEKFRQSLLSYLQDTMLEVGNLAKSVTPS